MASVQLNKVIRVQCLQLQQRTSCVPLSLLLFIQKIFTMLQHNMSSKMKTSSQYITSKARRKDLDQCSLNRYQNESERKSLFLSWWLRAGGWCDGLKADVTVSWLMWRSHGCGLEMVERETVLKKLICLGFSWNTGNFRFFGFFYVPLLLIFKFYFLFLFY